METITLDPKLAFTRVGHLDRLEIVAVANLEGREVCLVISLAKEAHVRNIALGVVNLALSPPHSRYLATRRVDSAGGSDGGRMDEASVRARANAEPMQRRSEPTGASEMSPQITDTP